MTTHLQSFQIQIRPPPFTHLFKSSPPTFPPPSLPAAVDGIPLS